MMVQLLYTEVAEVTVLRVNILACDRLTSAAELGLTKSVVKREGGELGDRSSKKGQRYHGYLLDSFNVVEVAF